MYAPRAECGASKWRAYDWTKEEKASHADCLALTNMSLIYCYDYHNVFDSHSALKVMAKVAYSLRRNVDAEDSLGHSLQSIMEPSARDFSMFLSATDAGVSASKPDAYCAPNFKFFIIKHN